jgi:hypothetical protein
MLKPWIFLSALAVLAAGCVTGAGVSVRNPGVASDMYIYDYYPDSEVYYSPSRHTYYYYEQDRWTQAPAPPRSVTGARVSMQIQDEQPYQRHAEHRRLYPPGQLKVGH